MLTPAQIKTNLVQWKGAGMRAWDVQILQSSSGKARLRVWDHNKKFGQSSSQHMAVISLREKRLRHRGGQDCWTLSSVLAVYLAFFRPVIFIDNKFDAFFFSFSSAEPIRFIQTLSFRWVDFRSDTYCDRVHTRTGVQPTASQKGPAGWLCVHAVLFSTL